MSQDMTKGSPIKLILLFSIPLLVGNLFQQFYNMVDAIIVGRFIDVKALAAVGSTGAVTFLVLGFVNGLTGGFSVVVAQQFGAGNMERLRRAVTSSVWLSLIGTVILTTMSLLLVSPLLKLMNTPDDIFEGAYIYLFIIMAGIGASMFYNVVSGILRAIGDSRTPLYFLVLACGINIVLDILFIVYFNSGVAGAAYATVIAQVCSGFFCLIYMIKKYPYLKPSRSEWRWDGHFTLRHLQVGVPMALQFSITAIGVIILQGAVNSFGSDTVAAYTAASKIEQICTLVMMALGTAIATYGGQNYGAGDLERIKKGTGVVIVVALISSVVSMAVMILFGVPMAQMFISESSAQINASIRQYLNTIAVFFPILSLLYIYRNVLQGIGNTFVPMMAGVMELIMRSLVVFLFVGVFGYTAVCFASPIAWVGATVPLFFSYQNTIKRLKLVMKKKEES